VDLGGVKVKPVFHVLIPLVLWNLTQLLTLQQLVETARVRSLGNIPNVCGNSKKLRLQLTEEAILWQITASESTFTSGFIASKSACWKDSSEGMNSTVDASEPELITDGTLQRKALTVSGIPSTLRRKAVLHLESMFSLTCFQSSSVILKRWIRWPRINRNCIFRVVHVGRLQWGRRWGHPEMDKCTQRGGMNQHRRLHLNFMHTLLKKISNQRILRRIS